MTLNQASCTLTDPCPRLRVVAVVLAAGTASRMGGRPKSLLLREGQTLLARLLSKLAQAGIDQTVLVLGHHAKLMQQTLQLMPPLKGPDLSRPKGGDPMPLHVVINPTPEAGQNSSLHLGLATAQALQAEWLMVALADQPLIEAEDLKALIAAVKQAPQSTQMLQPSVNGQPGNPVMFSARVMDSILQNPNSGGKAWRQHHPDTVLDWPSTNAHYCIDMDTPEDIAKLAKEHGIDLTWGQTS
jgi:CTP:molybdopterin cytidylyltransferase MocA